MIQRIQSVYLLLVALLMAATVFCPLLELTGEGEFSYIFSPLGIGQLFAVQYPTWGVVFFAGLSALFALVNIFLYKKRKLQMRVGTLTSLLILLFYITFYVYFNTYTAKYELTFSSFQFGLVLPIIALIFNILAILRIKKDENLVKSLDRIR
jgi:drug/metabolite transporter (DMT)-like permease